MNAMQPVLEIMRHNGTPDLPGLAVLAAVFVITGLLPIPRTPLCIAAGAIFGFWSALVIVPSTTIGGAVGFLLARHVLAGRLRRLAARLSWRVILEAIDSESWRIVALMRFGGPMPTVAQNYLFGLTNIGFMACMATTFFFIIPQICLYTYLGSLGRAALLDQNGAPLGWALGLIAAACMAVAFALVARKVRMALATDKGITR